MTNVRDMQYRIVAQAAEKTAGNVKSERKGSGEIQYKTTSRENGGRLWTAGDPPADFAGDGFPV